MFGFAARRAAVGKAGFIRLQFKLFRADGAYLERKCHPAVMIHNTQFFLMQSKRLTNTPIREVVSVLKLSNDGKNRVVRA